MARLLRNSDNEVYVCQGRLYNAAYGTIYVANVTAGTVLPDNWVYTDKDLEVEDFALPWTQPQGAHDTYALGVVVSHNGIRWRSTIAGNVWEPGVSGWTNADADIPAWLQPTGAHDAYAYDARVRYSNEIWSSLYDANVWAPGVYGWRLSAVLPPSSTIAIPAWVQPLGAHDAYLLGVKVTHVGKTWLSTVSPNVWEPGVYGWIEV